MKRAGLSLSLLVVALAFLATGCGKEEEYKVEGPKASDNPSVGAPVSAGGQPGSAVLDGAPPPGAKGAPPTPGDRGR